MPFRSQAQRAYMYANHPQLAKEFEDATPKGAQLPEHVKMAFGGETNPKHETVKSMENNPTAGFANGGTVGDEHPWLASLRDMLKSKEAPITKTDSALDEIDRLEKGPQASTDTVKGYADGGIAEQVEPGVMGDTEPVEQKMLKNTIAALSGIAMPGAVEGLAKGAVGLGEEGMARLGNAPKMEEDIPQGVDGITAYVKGVQKSPSGDINIWGVKGDPKMLLKHFGDEAPGSVPEHILRQKGILPEQAKPMNVNAPNSYADGGEVTQQTPDFMSVLGKMLPIAASYAPGAMPNIEAGAMTSPALAQLAGKVLPQNLQPSAPQPPIQDTQFMNQLNQGTAIQPPQAPQPQPQAPSLTQAAQTAQNHPATNYDFYKNMSAEDRNALYQKLTQQQYGTQANIGRGVAGLGDAISNSFGRGGAHAMQDINTNLQGQKEGQIGAMDTERQQKLQDVQARMTMMESDPNSAYSQGMRQFFTSNGIKVPSGMSAGMLKGLLPDMAKIFESRTQAATAAGAQGVEAGKALMGETLWDKVKEELGLTGTQTGEQYLESRIGGAKPTQNTGGWKVVR